MTENLGITEEISRPEAMTRLQEFMNINAAEATNLLWTTYHPYKLWLPFALVGFGSAVCIFFYSMWAKKYEKGI
jgi:hypothetical protein